MWKNLRDGFSKCLKKRDLLTRSGAGAAVLPQCQFFRELQFIKNAVTNRATHSNLNVQHHLMEDNGEVEELELVQSMQIPQQSESTICGSQRKKRLCQKTKQGEVSQDTQNLDKAIVHYLQKENAGKENADEMFCKSLVPILSTLPPQKNRRAKIKIQKLLYEIEFNEE